MFLELPTYLPQFGSANTEESLQSAAIGVLILAFLWLRPQGIFPERRRKLSRDIPAVASDGPAERSAGLVTDGESGEGARARALVTGLSPAAGPAQLAVRDLRRDFGGVAAVDGLSFELAPGQVTGLIGPNGAGKSTTLKLIAGALRPGAGQVLMTARTWPAGRPTR